jgi:leucyl-tRNA synthetase
MKKGKSQKSSEEQKIDFSAIEKKWQEAWEKNRIFSVSEDTKKKKFYCLEMFPYPSSSGLHMGHALNYTIGDIFARFKRMNGFNVLYPMGYDAFGLPAENAAIKAGEHPKKFTEESMKNFIKQQKALGLSYDWSRIIKTCESEYYKWNQYFFLKFFENNLVYRKKAAVNFCSKCNTVLANEQVHSGKCWRHTDTDVEIKHLEQWFIKTTKYSEELLRDVEKLKWPERIKIMQKNWIGKSFGVDINFIIDGKKWPIFTTRPDTIYGVTFMVISAQHPKLFEIVTSEQKKEVEAFLKKIKSTSEKDMEELEKEGVFTGSFAENPLTKEKVPVYAGNFVVADYGSGMVMAVPCHDQRDFEFAKKYKIPLKIVIQPNEKEKNLKEKEMKFAFTDEGVLVNSGSFNGINSKEAINKISDYIEKQKLGKKTVNYKFRDWLVSRQRYWGTPIPIVYCDKCGIVSVQEKDLPVILPEKVKFGEGNPLETNKDFVNTSCPKCKSKNARRETDTMDTFFDSSWYFLRYCDSKNNKSPFNLKKIEYWMPVDQYIGGAEHACMHLIYARFFVKALRDIGLLAKNLNEPFLSLFNQGMLYGNDGAVMSKSRGNVVLPEEVSVKYGIDTARLFLMSQASPDKDTQWNENGIEGSLKIINRIFRFFEKIKFGKSSAKIQSRVNKSIKEIAEDIENFRYNLGIIKLRRLFETFESEKEIDNYISKKDAEAFLKLLHPFCPHITEELWHKIGNKTFLSLESWPKCDESKIDEKLEKQEEQLDKLISDVRNILNILEARNELRGKKSIKIFAIPNEVKLYKEAEKKIEKIFNLRCEILSVKEAALKAGGKVIKASPGKPGILVE